MKRFFLLTALCCTLLPSCSLVEQRLKSESGLYSVPLSLNLKVQVDGIWFHGEGNPYEHQKSVVFYVAPLDVSLVEEDYPELAPAMVEQMHDLMKRELTKAFTDANRANRTQWKVTEYPDEADVRFDLAVVSLKTQRPGLHIAAKVLGFVAPTGVGDAVELIAKGDITLEGTIRDNRNGHLLMAFKDSNRAKMRLYHKKTYSRTGNVDANLQLWAEKLALLCREGAHDRLEDGTIKEKVDNRSVKDVIKARVQDSL